MSKSAAENKLYFTMRDVADLVGEDIQTIRYVLKKEKGARKRRGRWVTTRDQLLAAFPEAYRRLGA